MVGQYGTQLTDHRGPQNSGYTTRKFHPNRDDHLPIAAWVEWALAAINLPGYIYSFTSQDPRPHAARAELQLGGRYRHKV